MQEASGVITVVPMTDREPTEREPTIEDYEKFRELTVAQRHAYYLQQRGLETPNLIKAFSEVERGDFIPFEQYEGIFLETGIGIGHDQVNSWPTIVVKMLEKLQPSQGEKILDVGSGSGWTTALLAHCVGETGQVVGVERIEELADFGRSNIGKYRHTTNTEIHHTPTSIGWAAEAPYDKILVSAQINKVPDELVNQLAEGGEMLIPIVHTDEEIVELIREYIETHKGEGVELSQKDVEAVLEDNKKVKRSKSALYKKVDGELVEIDVMPEMTFVPLVIED